MKGYKAQFKGKKITIMGLGLLGRGLGYTKFLASCGADLTVTDLKTKAQLAKSIKALSSPRQPARNASPARNAVSTAGWHTEAGGGLGLIKFVLGKHKLEDFRDADMIIKSAGVPLDSIYIKEARKNNVPIEMDASLFAQIAPEVVTIGVTGTRGKSMTTMLIYEILKANASSIKISDGQGEISRKRKVYLGGNIRGVATLPLVKKVKDGDIVVMELDSWQLQGFGEAKISPDISVFTSFMPDHMNYYKNNPEGKSTSYGASMKRYFADKANIFKYQQKGDILIVCPEVKKLILKNIKSTMIVANKKKVSGWKFVVPGEHQLENLSAAVEVAKQFNIPLSKIKKAVADFKGVEGRLQYLKTIKGVKIYNDNNATTPEATIAGLEALGGKKNVILIAGGNDKNIELKPLAKAIRKYTKNTILIPGTGTDKLLAGKLKIKSRKAKNLKEAVKIALGPRPPRYAKRFGQVASRGDIILFSPAFSSFSQWNNEYERNDEFMKIIKGLK